MELKLAAPTCSWMSRDYKCHRHRFFEIIAPSEQVIFFLPPSIFVCRGNMHIYFACAFLRMRCVVFLLPICAGLPPRSV